MSEMPKTAMLFAAGYGKRLRPLTLETPKPLIKIKGKPIIEYSLDKLAEAGVEKVVINTHHLKEQLDAYVSAYKGPLSLHLSHEPELLETAGALVRAKALLGNDPFFCINGDVIWQDGPNSNALERLSRAYDVSLNATLLMTEVDKAIGYDGAGDFDIEGNTLLKSNDKTPYVFTGIRILHPRLFEQEEERAFSQVTWFKDAEQPDGALKGFSGLIHEGDWLHIGDEDGLKKANAYFNG